MPTTALLLFLAIIFLIIIFGGGSKTQNKPSRRERQYSNKQFMIRRNGMKKNKKENPLLGLLILGFFGFLIWMLFFGGVDKTIKEGTKLENKYNISQKVEKGIKTGVNTYAKAFEMIGTNVSNKSIKQKEIQNNKKQVELKEEIKQVKKPQTIDDLTGELDNF